MKKLIVAAVSFFVFSVANAELTQEELIKQLTFDKKVLCAPLENVIESITGKNYRENMTFVGESEEDSSKYTIFLNSSTRTWTILQVVGDTACILGAGKNFEIFKPKKEA